jgi:hypothetical protein
MSHGDPNMSNTKQSSADRNPEVRKAALDAMSYIASGWNIETAVACAHDAVYDVIGMNEFINVVQAEIRATVKQ